MLAVMWLVVWPLLSGFGFCFFLTVCVCVCVRVVRAKRGPGRPPRVAEGGGVRMVTALSGGAPRPFVALVCSTWPFVWCVFPVGTLDCHLHLL